MRTWRSKWLQLPRQLRYLVVGGLNTGFGYSLFALSYLSLRAWLPHMAILVISHVLAVSFSFFTHSRWVFTDTGASTWRHIGQAWVRFQVSYLGLLGLGLIVNAMLLRYVTPSVWWAQAGATGIGVLAGYWIHRHFVFQHATAAKPASP